MSDIPEGWKLVVVNAGFDDLMYWLGRCDEKGHLEQCSDLIDPWARFDYLPAPASLADAQAEIARLRGALESASNYVDNLGGVSKTFRSYLNK